ncbi:MAG: acyl-CoA/acyl-ACP dehydrogenase [Acidimicrobiia bacterium]|nr:acyl-CoA/acyl-ACP dehydrogenase [Acidimicrobiia bacterium]
MRFGWDEDQQAFQDAARDLLARACPPAVVRAAGSAEVLDRAPWDALAEMGVLAILQAEDVDGLGLDECSLVPVVLETGRAALPHPIVETALVAVPLGVGSALVASDLGGPLVACAGDADVLLLHVGGGLRTFAPDEVDFDPVPAVDRARRLARVRPKPGAAGALLTDDPAVVGLAHDRGVLGTAAQLVGLAHAMLDMTVAYVTERHQFGVSVGSFQAVKHHLADARLAIEFAGPAVARAAWSTATEAPTRARDVSMAKALATDAADVAGRAALQCHGAIGYTVEHDLHLFLKRAWALSRAWGVRAFHADRVAAALGI